MLQRISDQIRVLDFSQQSRAVASTEPALHRARKKTPMIFLLDLWRPLLGMKAQPTVTFCFPLAQQIAWNRIGESKSDEIDCASLLQVR
jgi:hypothetical protein